MLYGIYQTAILDDDWLICTSRGLMNGFTLTSKLS